MSCADYNIAIAEFVDGNLDPAEQRRLERHVEGCAACRALLADLKSIQAAAFTLDRLQPPPAIWESLRVAVAAEPAPRRRGRLLAWPETRREWSVWLAAAAALLIATIAGISPLLRPGDAVHRDRIATTPASDEELLASAQAEFQAAQQHYDKAIQDLGEIARRESGALDPQTAGVLQKNLQLIDSAIGETRAALQKQPASVDAQESLFAAMRSKVALLQQTIELIDEMRKGNQAEAGRLIQGLNQG